MVFRFWQEDKCNWCEFDTMYCCDVCGRRVCASSHATTIRPTKNTKIHLCPDHKDIEGNVLRVVRCRNQL